MKGRKVQLKVFYWRAEDENEGTKTVIHVGGRTTDNETVHALIEGFTPYVNIELPIRIEWDKYKAEKFYKHLKSAMGKFGPVGEWKLCKKSQLHYLKDLYIIKMNFPSSEAVRKMGYLCNNARGIYIPSVGQFWAREFKVHEANIDPILKMSAAKNLQLANWIELTETIPEKEIHDSVEERKFTTADIDLKVYWEDIKSIDPPENVYITPTFCSFDLECNSTNHNSKLPNPELPENVVMQVSMIFGVLDKPESRKHVLISLGEPRKEKIPTCDELRIFQTERELLLGFSALVREHDPDLFIHYNGMKFDWDYLIKRAEFTECFVEFSDMSRMDGRKAIMEKMKWSSQAYGEQIFRYLECHGRTNVDVLIEIERNHRLPNYRLDTVAERFLGQNKENVSARELFMLWDLTHDVYPFVKNREISPKELIQWRAKICDIFEIRKCTGSIVKNYRAELLKTDTKKFAEKCREAMEIVGIYCIQDTILPIELIEKLNIWKSMEAMSNVTHVPVSYLHTRGQQIKVLSQVYRETILKNMVIPTFPKSDKVEKFEGATVIEANAGDYTNVATLDFASLYPTVMIAFNISYDTILEDDDPTPDSECHVLEFKSHCGCEHDEKKRKKKAEDVICRDYRYRFRKVKYHIDKKGKVTREHEGVMPRLERNLMASRKVAKKEMAKVEALLKTHTGKATEDDIKFYTKMGWRMVEKGELGKNEATMAEINFNTLNANQLALKVSCNSVGGNTPIPCLVNGQFRYLAIESLFSKDFTVDDDGNELCNGPQNIQVWSDKGWADIKYVIRHEAPKVMHRVLTPSGCVDVSADHSLLDEFGKEVKATELDYGDKLLHISAPLPEDTPMRPLIPFDRIKDIPKPRLVFELIDKYLSDKYENRLWFFLLNLPDLEKGIQGSLNASRWYYFLKSLGYSVTISRVLGDIHFFGLSENTVAGTYVKAFDNFTSNPGEYIYDIETSTHHFAAGVGDMIVHNSAYGCMGVNNGMLPLIAGAASVTAMGRRLIMMAIDRIKKEYAYANVKLVYGDSVARDTPILCRLNGRIFYRTIENLSGPVIEIEGDEKEYIVPEKGLEVWSDTGFTKIKHIIRHKTSKKMFRVLTHTGCVDVTEDHSLLNENAEKITPNEIKVGDMLLHKDLPKVGGNISNSIAYAMGLFYGDGSCGRYDCPSSIKYAWAINNTNLDFLNKAKACLDEYYKNVGIQFKIYDTMESSHVYKLEPNGKSLKSFVNEWRSLFYDQEKYKKVPDEIFEYDEESRRAFFDGYYAADGDKDKLGYLRFDNKGKIGSAGLYLLANSFDYPVSINIRNDKPKIFRMTLTRNGKKQRINPDKIKKIVELPPTTDYVYDLETENHHFAAGIGRMVVHNTDSCMIHFTGKSLTEAWGLAEEASKIATHAIKCYIVGVSEDYTVGPDKIPIAKFNSDRPDFKDLTFAEQCHVLDYQYCPIDLEFENFYSRYLLLTKKRYIAYAVNRKGDILSITKKGVVLTRRDNSKYLRDTYEATVKGILDDIAEQDVMYRLYDRIQLLFTGQITAQQLIIYMGVKTIVNYAKSKKEKKGRTIVSQVPVDKDGVMIDDLLGPLDPRLVYPNLPQVLLALKMMKRGEDIPPNTRLEFLYLLTENWNHQGEKAEDYTYYKEYKDIENLKPDYLHYVEKQLAKPITELISVKFKKGIVPFIPIEDKFRACISELNSSQRVQVARNTLYIKLRPVKKHFEEYFVGWDVLKKEGYEPEKDLSLSKDKPFKSYTFKKLEAQASFVLDDMKYRISDDPMTLEKYPDFYNLSTWYKSVEILNRLHKQYGVKKRKWIRPTRSADKLEANVCIVVLVEDYQDEGVHKGDTGKILQRVDSGDKKNPVYTYTLMMGNAETDSCKIIKNVPRNTFTTFTVKDGKVMDNIYEYRKTYMKIVNELKELGSMITIIEEI